MAIAKVILNGNTLIDTTDKTVASSNLLYPNTALGADGEAVTGEVKIEDITINQDYLVEQNTVISNGIIFQTDETYPGTPVVLNNTSYANINNGDLGINGTGIKIELNRTYHCIGELKIEWSTGEQEIYSIDSDFTLSNYSVKNLPFSWEGIGISTQTFNYIYLNFVSSSANGYKIFMRPTTANVITKSGVLLDGSYYQISVTSDGFNTINLNLSDNPKFQAIYKSLAYRSIITSSAPGVSEWCNSLSRISRWQFAGQEFAGSFTFNNVTNVFQGAFGVVWNGNGTSVQTSAWFNFPNSALSILYQDTFLNNGMIRGISANNVNLISNTAFCSCGKLSEVNFPNCTTISSSAFQSCSNLTTVSFPECTSIGGSAFSGCSNLTTVSFPECTTISNNAFYGCSNLSTISFPKCTTISNFAFYNCSKLTTVSFPECTSIGYNAFQSCSALTTADFPSCITIGTQAFQYCSALSNINFPECTTIGANVFQNCTSLSNISFPECTSIGNNAFQGCSSLTTISFPECTSIGNSAFCYCTNLTTISFPKCTSIGSQAFYSCSNLTTISFPKCTTISNSAFYYCSNLTTISFPECTSIGYNAFYSCKKLESAYFMGSSIPSIGTYIFSNTPITSTIYLGYYGSIYVPSSLLASYKTATNWTAFSSRMVGI